MSLRARKAANLASPGRMFREELAEILAGLAASQKHISPKYFYDQRGSELFDAICGLPEYYLTRTEQRIMNAHLPEMAALVGPGASVIEFGAGSNAKARQLLAALDEPVAYVPVEISGEYLASQVGDLARDFPGLSVIAVVADFTRPFNLPAHPVAPRRNLVFFPGSTIGNFTRDEARALLQVMRTQARPGGALLVGVDLVKDVAVIEPAYNDRQGVTAAFNRNALHHLNAAFGANFDPGLFRHEAVYDERHNRIEMRLIARRSHAVRIAGRQIAFARDEYIITEYSHKYSVADFVSLAWSAGLTPERVWLDDARLFSVHYLTVP